MSRELENALIDKVLKINEHEAWLNWRRYDNKIETTNAMLMNS